jgi:HlyD family secretion protein
MDAFGNRQFQGAVRRIAPFVMDWERQARTVDVEVDFINPVDIKRLLAGYSADVEIILESHPDTLRVPSEAVLEGKRVYVYSEKEGVVHERNFKKGISNWDYTEVISGLNAGEKVVTNVDQTGIQEGARAVISKENQ